MLADTSGFDLIAGGWYTVTVPGFKGSTVARFTRRVFTTRGWEYMFETNDGLAFAAPEGAKFDRLAG